LAKAYWGLKDFEKGGHTFSRGFAVDLTGDGRVTFEYLFELTNDWLETP